MTKEEILAAFEWRHACKEFDVTQKIPRDDFEFLLKTVSLSPSSFGLQPYEIFVLQNQDLLKAMHPHMWGAQKQLFTCSDVLMFTVKKDLANSDEYLNHILINVQNTPIEMQEIRRNLIKQHFANEIKTTLNSQFLFDWCAKQAYISLGNLMQAASCIGIDSCPIEGFISEKITSVLAESETLDPSKYEVIVFCCLGYRLNHPSRPKVRKSIEDLVHFI